MIFSYSPTAKIEEPLILKAALPATLSAWETYMPARPKDTTDFEYC